MTNTPEPASASTDPHSADVAWKETLALLATPTAADHNASSNMDTTRSTAVDISALPGANPKRNDVPRRKMDREAAMTRYKRREGQFELTWQTSEIKPLPEGAANKARKQNRWPH